MKTAAQITQSREVIVEGYRAGLRNPAAPNPYRVECACAQHRDFEMGRIKSFQEARALVTSPVLGRGVNGQPFDVPMRIAFHDPIELR